MNKKKQEYGQFFTNPWIAEFMAKQVISNETKTILDPAVGMGAFTKQVHRLRSDIQITACEVDPEMVRDFYAENHYPVRMYETDYLSLDIKQTFDAILCNPPYLKFQQIPNRKELKSDFLDRYGITMSGYSNLCVYFLIKSMHQLRPGGRCCYIIPYEFLNAGYGKAVKEYLLASKMLKKIYQFDHSLQVFEDAITTSCIILLENTPQKEVEFIRIEDLGQVAAGDFSKKKTYSYDHLDASQKWITYFDFSQKEQYHNLVPLSEFGRVSRGIATGCNRFFVLNSSMIAKHCLSEAVCVPCITKSSDVKDLVFTQKSFDSLAGLDKKVYLFDGEQAKTESDFRYLETGRQLGVDQAYLTSHRTPWYAIESKTSAPIWFCVFHRKEWKVVRNEANIKNLTTFHGLYLKETSLEFANLMFCYLLTPVARQLMLSSRREYGDGLMKFEPGDLNRAMMLDLRKLSLSDKETVALLYQKIKGGETKKSIQQLDAIFRSYLQ